MINILDDVGGESNRVQIIRVIDCVLNRLPTSTNKCMYVRYIHTKYIYCLLYFYWNRKEKFGIIILRMREIEKKKDRIEVL